MFGLEDGWVAAAFVLCILSTLLCIVYGAITWNRGDENVTDEDVNWAKEEDRVVEEL
jgi:hypothetical protein